MSAHIQESKFTIVPAELHDRILGFMPLTDLSRFSQTSRHYFSFSKDHAASRVKTTLREWDLPLATLSFMKEKQIVISGSGALNIVQPCTIIPNDLDIYVPRGSLPSVHNFLKENTLYEKIEGTSVAILENKVDYETTRIKYDAGINEVDFYRHQKNGSLLNVIETAHGVATTAIFKFHTTFVMNYVTWNTIVCAYPKMTEDYKGLVNAHTFNLTPKFARCMAKYAIRGFNTLDRAYDWRHNEHDCKTYGYCGQAQRSVEDHFTMRFCFLESIGADCDVIDPKVTWSLSCRYNCRVQKEIDPIRGFVKVGNDVIDGEP